MAGRKKRYAQVGLGGRSIMYTEAIVGRYHEGCELVGLCDINQSRMDLANRKIADRHAPVKTYQADEFDRMMAETRPDVVVVTSMDSTHNQYICRAMELGCDAVTEKPMTTDETKCRQILKTIERTGRKLQVTFNYRYAPPRSQVKEILASGAIGDVLSVHYEWLLDTKHGADYFRRWHRRRENSGSLLVHKATHHFDVVNWWIDDTPDTVFANGSRRYYVPATAEAMGLAGHGERCLGCPVSDRCKFYLDMSQYPRMRELYLDCEKDDGYFRDRCVFSDQVNIWDTMSVAVRYRCGALMSYSLMAYAPYEGYRIAFTGTKGRLEHVACEDTYMSGDGTVPGELKRGNTTITLIPAFGAPRRIEVHTGKGGHGRGDDPLLADVFDPDAPPDPLGRKADHRDGTRSILVGIAACHSIDSGKAVSFRELLGDAYPLLDGKE